MTEQEIIEGDKLIAEFMGWKQKSGSDEWAGFWIIFPDEKSNNDMLCESEYLRFHKSWDWLMPVWTKFRFIDITNIVVGSQAKTANQQHNQLIGVVGKFIAFQPIECAFDKMVQVIRWFNEIKSK
jgi:hypothetical protein